MRASSVSPADCWRRCWRPAIFLTLPLVTDAFHSAMAVTIMVGLAFATVLAVIVIPLDYALLLRVRR